MSEPVLVASATCASGTAPRAIPVRAVDGVSLRDRAPARPSGWSASPAAASRRSGRGVLGLLPESAAVPARSATAAATSSALDRRRSCATLRGPELGLIFQEPMTRLDPLITIEQHFLETLRAHEPDLDKDEMRRRSLEALAGMGIPPTRFRQYPHEFSGGMRQRIMIALALVLRAEARRRRRADDRARRDRRGADPRHPRRPAQELRHGAAADHPQPRDRRRGLRPGRGDVRRARSSRRATPAQVFSEPGAPLHARAAALDRSRCATTGLHYIPGAPPNLIDPPPACRFHPRCPNAMRVCAEKHPIEVDARRRPAGRLLAARPRGARSPRAAPSRSSARRSRSRRRRDEPDAAGEPLLEVRDLHTHFSVRGSFLDRLRGREAGLGQGGRRRQLRPAPGRGARASSASRARARRRSGARCSGLVEASDGLDPLRGRGDRRPRARADLRPLRQRLQIVFQDPHASLNPAMTIGASVGDPLRFHELADDARGARARWSPRRSSGSAWRRPSSSSTSTRATSPAGRSSAPCSPGRSSSTPTCWSPTSRSRCST